MTSPQPLPPHQDPTHNSDLSKVTMMEYVTTLIAQLDRRFDTLHADLKESIVYRLAALDDRYRELFRAADLRYEQRFQAQQVLHEAALKAQKDAVATAMAAAERQTSKAERDAEKRFESVNEFRQQLSDQAATFIPRLEAEQRIKALADKVEMLQAFAAATTGKGQGANALFVAIIGVVSLIGAIIALVAR